MDAPPSPHSTVYICVCCMDAQWKTVTQWIIQTSCVSSLTEAFPGVQGKDLMFFCLFVFYLNQAQLKQPKRATTHTHKS